MKPDEQAQREKIARWQREGADIERSRKSRNHALIHLGLSTLKMIQDGKMELVDALRNIPDSKHKVVRSLVED